MLCPGTVFNVTNDFLMFNFTLEGSELEFWGLNFTGYGFECIPADCSNVSTSQNGGTVSVAIKINATETFFTELFFKRFDEELVFRLIRRVRLIFFQYPLQIPNQHSLDKTMYYPAFLFAVRADVVVKVAVYSNVDWVVAGLLAYLLFWIIFGHLLFKF